MAVFMLLSPALVLPFGTVNTGSSFFGAAQGDTGLPGPAECPGVSGGGVKQKRWNELKHEGFCWWHHL